MKTTRHITLAAIALAMLLVSTIRGEPPAVRTGSKPASAAAVAVTVPEPPQPGGEPQSIVQVANLVYAGTKSSKCFSDHFLVKAEKESAISTSRRFHAVKLASEKRPPIFISATGEMNLAC